MSGNKSDILYVRISEEDKQDFLDKCQQDFNRSPSDMVREMIKAFNENRLTIQPTEAEKGVYK